MSKDEYRQIDKWMDGQIDRQMDRQINGWIDRQIDRQMDRKKGMDRY